MVRRTKVDAEGTREALLDAAEAVFHAKGVAGASLEEIARTAGLTRGALYWHFRDKAELFGAMLDRVWLPFAELIETTAEPEPPAEARDALDLLRLGALTALRRAEQPQMQRVHAIILHRCGIVPGIDPMTIVREKAAAAFADTLGYFQQAQQAGTLAPGLDPLTANWLLHSHIRGLIYSWHLDPQAFSLTETGTRMLDWLFASFRC